MSNCGQMRGFTLLEIMLVILLLATSASLIMGTMPDSEDNQRTTETLTRKLQALAEDALMDGKIYGAVVYSDGVQFMLLKKMEQKEAGSASGVSSTLWPGGRWFPLHRGVEPYRIPASMTLALSLEGHYVMLTKMKAAVSVEPQLFFLPGGGISTFRIEVQGQGDDRGEISSQGVGVSSERVN